MDLKFPKSVNLECLYEMVLSVPPDRGHLAGGRRRHRQSRCQRVRQPRSPGLDGQAHRTSRPRGRGASEQFRGLPVFAAGVLLALQAGVDAGRVDALAIGFVLARVVYIACYVTDRASMRSLFWALGYLCVLALYALALLA